MSTSVSKAVHSGAVLCFSSTRSFDDIHKSYHGRIRAAVSRYNWSGADRDDLHQAGRVALWRAFACFDSRRGASFDAYATRAIYRGVRDEVRRHLTYAARVANVALQSDVGFDSSCDQMDGFPGASLDPESEFDRELLLGAIDTLPVATRRTYVLRNYLGMTQAQTAVALGVTQQRASQIEKRLVTDLRKVLGMSTKE